MAGVVVIILLPIFYVDKGVLLGKIAQMDIEVGDLFLKKLGNIALNIFP